MFIIWGIGHRTTKIAGIMTESLCGRCNNRTARKLIKLTSWFTIFFIPVIPYSRQYLLVCPICGQAQQLTKAEFDSLANAGINDPAPGGSPAFLSDDIKYAGKTPTQIAFLKHMESIDVKNNNELNTDSH